ncbi:hypothetical protein VC83_03823 [Pseudogymnoascus destructans]|uniref:Uncharacterized protein n=2 Tax=Pseudogymnoascus destructans TaxID=655981 RepID=L8FV53_PSED2|nr:uncharacterized protein VC83_03823 [Pseudogymnoascus destructans]ELR03591.1 hypothetical protein GMDG_06245 [Pseudogymnoascus destructans 20631-21]OAF59558.1 hypothetical protein VC83_03823 [Pseudogymnoascus destructans]
MIPPIDSAVLAANPKFALLHKTLVTKHLKPDGGTRNHPKEWERHAQATELKTLRLKFTRAKVLQKALEELPLTSPAPASTKTSSSRQSTPVTEIPLPAKLTELIILLTLSLRSPTALPLPNLSANIQAIAALVSTHLTSHALPLTRLMNPHTNPSFLHRQIPSLAISIIALRDHVTGLRLRLAAKRTTLTDLAVKLLHLYTAQAATVIRILEQTTHGCLSRHSRAHAEMLSLSCATTAAEAESKSRIAADLVYGPEAVRALQVYREHLRDGKVRMESRKGGAERELGRYGVGREEGGKERIMREIARVWEEMEGEVEEVKGDIGRLRGR